MATSQNQNPIQTAEITNFSGGLTRILNGDLNSGLAKFTPSWGYDPFSKPQNLTWFEQPTSILSSSSGLILAAKPRFNSGSSKVYAVDRVGTLYTVQPTSAGNPNVPNLDTASVIGAVAANSPTFNYGASIEFYGATEKIYVGGDATINSINFDGSGDTNVVSATNLLNGTFRMLRQFSGKLIFNNGNTVGAIGSTGTVTSSIIGTGLGNLYSEFNPPLSVESRTQDLDISPDGNYLMVTASGITDESIANFGNDSYVAGAATDGAIYFWNGSDVTVTAQNTIPSYAVTALQTYLNKNMFFANDSFGASLNDGTNKLLSLPNNKSPLPNATLVNGNFISWVAPETTTGSDLVGSMYYFGSLDQENPSGLFRVMRYSSTLAGGFIFQTPLNILASGMYTTISANKLTVSPFSYGKHYFSVWDLNSSTNSYKFLRFLVTSSGTGVPQLGVYETQTQLFSKRITVKQIRVYTEPTVSGNGFQIDCIGGDGSVITNSATKTYTFAAGSDPTLLQGALERIDFNPVMKDTFALGIRITNTGTVNMTIKKIEVDWAFSGK